MALIVARLDEAHAFAGLAIRPVDTLRATSLVARLRAFLDLVTLPNVERTVDLHGDSPRLREAVRNP